MPQRKEVQKLLALLGIAAGIAVCFLAVQINYKAALLTGSASGHFQSVFAQISLSLIFLGVMVSCGSLFLVFRRADKPEPANVSPDDIAGALRNFGIESGSDPMQSLNTSIGALKLELVESKKRERAIIEKAVDVICVIDIEARFITVSRASMNAWGYAPQELERRPLTDILSTDSSDQILNSILGSANSIDKIIFECRIKRKDGRLLDVVWTAHWSASDGGLFCIVHDISERKIAEQLLKDSESRLRRMLQELPVGVLLVKKDGSIESSNAEAERMLGFDAAELAGSALRKHITLGEKPADAVTEAQHRRLQGTATRKDSSVFPVDISEGIVELGEEDKSIVVFIDKTAEKELERVKREFVAMVTHEIRTPISSVYGILELIETGAVGELSKKGIELTRAVKVTCKRVIGLINDLLDLEKIQSGKFSLDCKQVSLRYAMETSADNVAALTAERKLTLNLPQTDLLCWADEDRLVQVMVNLISNAIKNSPENSTIALEIEDRSNGFLKISVVDKGRGIPEDKLGMIFDKFEQVEYSDAKKKGGTGLGLSICQGIVAEHGGEIGVESKLGEGSRFWFTIPASEEAESSGPRV